ncbi:WbqC family protein [Proteus sp. FME41]|uniref:WbqC family protein n=1 Tax=Proteus sp. FME41 TaxID=2742608 RepID=UPI001867E1C7|nr:WbqC family protein [Proteus sp. FME41]
MKLAVMQPYLFPYIGYYQLAYCNDIFVFYDDVNYIKNGYINRNSILTKNGIQLFTLPVIKASSFKKINELYFQENIKKILTSIYQNYSKAPYFSFVYPIIEKILTTNDRNVANITSLSVIKVFEYLSLNFNYKFSSTIDYERTNSAQEKIYNLCKIHNAKKYINSIGGMKLYNKEEFKKRNIELGFIESSITSYSQITSSTFIGNLSMIDILMNCSKDEIINQLNNFKII